MSDREVQAMSTLAKALEDLDQAARLRVLRWAYARFGGDEPEGNPPGGSVDPVDNNRVDESNDGEYRFELFSDLYDAADPSTKAERALVGGYWFQYVKGQDTFVSQEVNSALKNLGHGIGKITRAMNKLQDEKPRLARQVRKKGSTRQARKDYKLTIEGKRRVEDMISNAG